MKIMLTTTTAVALISGAAHAAIVTETESNDTFATANDIGTYDFPGDGIVVDGEISAATEGEFGDVDWFSFSIDNTATAFVAALFDLNPDEENDGIMALFDSNGDEIIFDDDSGIDLMPSLQAFNLAVGTYYLAISGFDDSDFVGDHNEAFEYKLVLGLNIPAPAGLAALGLGGLVATRRRR